MRERTQLANATEGVRRLEREVADAMELAEMAEAEGDAAMVADAVRSLRAMAEESKRREIESLLSGEADANDAFLEVNAGAGGTEAQDWAEMLLRMYSRWAEQHGYKLTLIEESEGEQAGLKSATVQVSGPKCLWLAEDRGGSAPAGAHQPVRQRGAPADQLCLGLGVSGGGRHHRDRDQRGRPEGGHLPGLRRRLASTSTRPRARSASPTCRPGSSSPARPTDRSIATGRRRWEC